MTPEEIKKLLMLSKAEGLSGGTLKALHEATKTPQRKEATQRQFVAEDLKNQHTQGLQPTLGPAGLALPSMGLLADTAPAAIGLGTELGSALKQGYVSNQNFDNAAIAALGFGAMPLFAKRKGEGKLYSRLVDDLQNAGDMPINPTSLGKFIAKGKYSADELKALDVQAAAKAMLEQKKALSAKEFSDHLYKTKLENELSGRVESEKPYLDDDYDETQYPFNIDGTENPLYNPQAIQYGEPQAAASFSEITFPQIARELQKHISFNTDDIDHRNILMNRPQSFNRTDHWAAAGGGDVHARTGYNQYHAGNPIGIIAEVQSDLQKGGNFSNPARAEAKNSPFVQDYENVATRQALLDLIQTHATERYKADAPLQVVWPSGKLQQELNLSQSPAYTNIYDRRIPKAISKALGDDAVIQQMQHAPYTPIEYKTTPWYADDDVYAKIIDKRDDLGARDYNLSFSEADRLAHKAFEDEGKFKNFVTTVPSINALDPKAEIPTNNTIDSTIQDIIKLSLGPIDDYINSKLKEQTGPVLSQNFTRDFLRAEWMRKALAIEEDLLDFERKKLVSKYPNLVQQSPLFSTTIPATKVDRLAKEGIPLWMLPIGAGLGAMPYNSTSSAEQ